MKCVLALVLMLLALPAAAQNGRTPITVADAHRLADVTEAVFSPVADWLVYTLERHNLADDRIVSDLWQTSWAGAAPKPLTRTPKVSEWQPGFSPDGRTLYFLSDGAKDETTQLWAMPARGGKARQITRIAGGIEDYHLAPDGKRAVIVAEIGTSIGLGEDVTPPPIVIDRFAFKEDYRGFMDDRARQLFLIDLPSGKATQLTRTPVDHDLPAWSPDGRWIAFVSKRGAGADRTLNHDVFIIAPQAGAAERQISRFAGADSDPAWESRPAWSPDSSRLVYLTASDDKWIYYAPQQLTVADIQTGVITTPARIDRWFTKPRWSADGRHIHALMEQDRATAFARIDAASGAVTDLSAANHGARVVYDYAEGPGGKLAVLESAPLRPTVLRTDEADARVLADPNDWLDGRQLAGTQAIEYRSEDGTTIGALLVLPANAPPGKPLPLIVDLHGGPVYQFSHEFMFKWQVLAAHGYAVLAPNPRGSSGRGFDFSRAIYADWGNLDVADVKAGIDHLIAGGRIDPARIGVGGWSYGGILTNYMIASDPRIKAAVSGAGLSNVLATWGHDAYSREYLLELGTPWDDFATYARVSYPFLKPQTIVTPTLFLCAEADFNVPCIGAEQMYHVLKHRNVPTRLVIYPGENHGLIVPSYIADRYQRTLDWYAEHLKPEH